MYIVCCLLCLYYINVLMLSICIWVFLILWRTCGLLLYWNLGKVSTFVWFTNVCLGVSIIDGLMLMSDLVNLCLFVVLFLWFGVKLMWKCEKFKIGLYSCYTLNCLVISSLLTSSLLCIFWSCQNQCLVYFWILSNWW